MSARKFWLSVGVLFVTGAAFAGFDPWPFKVAGFLLLMAGGALVFRDL